ncbi:hypothetical protein HY346_00985 [Candidatus Microgenomates bacterium]|nr:hypothetical protein [Candidatus Microgenomates bacterium]
MKKYLIRFALWLLDKCRYEKPRSDHFYDYIDELIGPDLLAKAASFIAEVSNADTSGEYKRHAVYAKLQKCFPNQRHWILSLAIELAIANERYVA